MSTTPNFRRNGSQSSTPQPIAPSEKQVSFLNSLIDQIAEFDPAVAVKHREDLRRRYMDHTLTGGREGTASQTITELQEQLHLFQESGAKRVAAVQNEDWPQIPEGRYAVDNESGVTAFYSVSHGRDGRIWVRVYASDNARPLQPKQSLTILRKIEKDGPMEASVRFGKEWGICGVCGRGLTNAESRAAGIGPVCQARITQ